MYDLLKIPDEFLQLLHHPYYVTNMFWIKDSLLIPRIESGPCAHKQKKAWQTQSYVLSKEHICFQDQEVGAVFY